MHRLLKPSGRVAFTTIHLAPDLSRADRRRGAVSGPPAVVGPDGRELLARARFADVAAYDVTDDYLATATAWRGARLRHRDTLRPLAPEIFDDRIAQCDAEVAALDAGLLRRTLYVATRG